MAAVAAAPLSNLATHSCQQQQQQHPEQQSAFSQVSASTNCHSSIGQMGNGVLNRFLGMGGGILLGREQELVAPHHSAPPPVAAPVMWQSRTARSLASSLQSSEKSGGSQSSTSVPSPALDPVRQAVNGGAAWLVGGSCSLVQPVAESAGALVNADTGSGNKSRLSNNITLKRARESHDGIGQSLAVATSPALTLEVAKTPVPSRRTRSAFATT